MWCGGGAEERGGSSVGAPVGGVSSGGLTGGGGNGSNKVQTAHQRCGEQRPEHSEQNAVSLPRCSADIPTWDPTTDILLSPGDIDPHTEDILVLPAEFAKQRWTYLAQTHPWDRSKIFVKNARNFVQQFVRQSSGEASRAIASIKVVEREIPVFHSNQERALYLNEVQEVAYEEFFYTKRTTTTKMIFRRYGTHQHHKLLLCAVV